MSSPFRSNLLKLHRIKRHLKWESCTLANIISTEFVDWYMKSNFKKKIAKKVYLQLNYKKFPTLDEKIYKYLESREVKYFIVTENPNISIKDITEKNIKIGKYDEKIKEELKEEKINLVGYYSFPNNHEKFLEKMYSINILIPKKKFIKCPNIKKFKLILNDSSYGNEFWFLKYSKDHH